MNWWLVAGLVIILLAVVIMIIQNENATLAQEYEWAMEMAKLPPDEKKDIVLKVKEQILV